MENLPQVCKVKSVQESLPPAKNLQSSDMRIAWRYNALPSIDLDVKSTTYFDSSKKIDGEMLAKSDIEIFKENDKTVDISTKTPFRNPNYSQILFNLKNKLTSSKFSIDDMTASNENDKNLLRISISSLGSPIWYDNGFQEDVCLFLFYLKALIRTSLAVGFITIPSHLFKYLVSKRNKRMIKVDHYHESLKSR